jgi:hypothetical protein
MRKLSSAAGRARWLAEVAQALDDAKALVERMGGSFGGRRERAELIERIEAARQATRSLRLSSERRIGAASSSRMNEIAPDRAGRGPAA